MIQMLCRNRVADFARCKAVFDSHRIAHAAAGLRLRHVWREAPDSQNVFFLFDVADLGRARRFVDAREGGKRAGLRASSRARSTSSRKEQPTTRRQGEAPEVPITRMAASTTTKWQPAAAITSR